VDKSATRTEGTSVTNIFVHYSLTPDIYRNLWKLAVLFGSSLCANRQPRSRITNRGGSWPNTAGVTVVWSSQFGEHAVPGHHNLNVPLSRDSSPSAFGPWAPGCRSCLIAIYYLKLTRAQNRNTAPVLLRLCKSSTYSTVLFKILVGQFSKLSYKKKQWRPPSKKKKRGKNLSPKM
jgi:hypothetical protein